MILLARSASSARSGIPPRLAARLYLLGLTLGSLGLLLFGWSHYHLQHPRELLLFGGLAAAAGSQKLPLPAGRGSWISPGFTFVLLGLSFLGGPEALLIAGVSSLAGSLRRTGASSTGWEALFNLSASILSAGIARSLGLLFSPSLGDPYTLAGLGATAAAAAIYFLVNSLLVVGALVLNEPQPFWRQWYEGLTSTLPAVFAGCSIALLMTLAYRLPQHALFYLSLPLAYGLFTAYQATLERVDVSRRHVQELATANEAVEAERHRYQDLFEFAPDGYLVTDAEGRIQTANHAAAQLLHSPISLLVDQPIQDYVVASERSAFHSQLSQLRQEELRENWAIRLGPPHAPVCDAVLSVAVMRDRQGELMGLRWLLRDVTEQKWAWEVIHRHDEERRLRAAAEGREAQLRHLHEVIRGITSSLELDAVLRRVRDAVVEQLGFDRCAVFTVDSDGTHARGYWGTDRAGQPEILSGFLLDLRLNAAMGGSMGLVAEGVVRYFYTEDLDAYLRAAGMEPQADVEGVSHSAVLPINAHQRVVGLLAVDNLLTGRPFSPGDLEVLQPFLDAAGVAIDNAGAYHEAHQRLEALRTAQERMVQTEKLRSLGEISAGIAHDVNNSLMAILAHVQIAERHSTDAEVRERLAIVEQAIMDGAEVVKRLRQFARQQTEEVYEVADLAELAASALALARPRWRSLSQWKGTGLQVATELAPAPVMGNDAELREAVLNLLTNAVEAMPHGGTLTLRTWSEAESAFLTVSDTGVGMSEEVLERCIDPFFTTKGPQGTGLGLAMYYGVVARHGGELILDSAPDRGSTIGFQLRRAVGTPTLNPVSEPARLRRSRLLFVEDDPWVREGVADGLRAAGHDVQVAADAVEGLALLEKDRFNLVITDQGLPGQLGTELAAIIEQKWPGLPVLLLTGWSEEVQSQVRSGNVVGTVSKPATIATLITAIAATQGQPSGSTLPHRPHGDG